MPRSTCRSAASSSSMSTAITAEDRRSARSAASSCRRDLRAQAAASPDPDIRALADLARPPAQQRRRETSDVAAGAAWIDGDNNVGFSVNRYDSLYGVPVRYSLDPAVEAEAPRIDIAPDPRRRPRRDRHRRRASSTPSASAAAIPTIAISSSRRRARSAPPSSPTASRAGWRSSSRSAAAGAAASACNISTATSTSSGEEKFLPRQPRPASSACSRSRRYDRGALRAEGGARYEHQSAPRRGRCRSSAIRPCAAASTPSPARSAPATRSRPAVGFGLNGSHSRARARRPRNCSPTGRTPAPRAFEIGDPDLGKERSWGLEATLRGDGRRLQPVARPSSTAGSTITSTSSRPARSRTICRSSSICQADARYFGVELEGSVRLGTDRRVRRSTWTASPIMCARRSEGAGPAPRIPPLPAARRARGAVGPGATAAIEVERTSPGRTGSPPSRRRRDGYHDGQRLALRSIRSASDEHQRHRPVGEQHLRRRRPPPRQLPQGLCPARRPRHQDHARASPSEPRFGSARVARQRPVVLRQRFKLTESLIARMMIQGLGARRA